ncbi:MAG: helical backbone metal receptor [Candidatus Cloacimonetes bacterium]|nr:helical backbone metal receptor [Candidatus Cloacimonadota bacterium]
MKPTSPKQHKNRFYGRKPALILGALLALVMLLSCADRAKQNSERFVILSPELAELIAELDGFGRIVAVTEECTYPKDFSQVPKIGKFGNLDLEKILAYKPSHIFTTSLELEGISAELKKLGFKVTSIYPKNISELLVEIEKLGILLDRQENAVSLINRFRSTIQTLNTQNADKTKPRVYLEIYRDPLMSVSDKSFVGELIEIAGGDNIFTTLERDYSRIKAEDVISLDPEIIICYSQDTLQRILARKGWQNVSAIKNHMIFFEPDLDPDLIQRAGPRAIDGLLRLHELIENYRTSRA